MRNFFLKPEGLIYLKFYIHLCLSPSVSFSFRQVFKFPNLKPKEKTGARRIIQYGPRGDVIDRNGELLIGNRASFAAVPYRTVEREIWQSKLN